MTIILNANLREAAFDHIRSNSGIKVRSRSLFTGQLAAGLPMPGSEEVLEQFTWTYTDRKGNKTEEIQEVRLYEQYVSVRGGGYKWLEVEGYNDCCILAKNKNATLVYARWGVTQLSGTNLPERYQRIMENPWMSRAKFHSVLID